MQRPGNETGLIAINVTPRTRRNEGALRAKFRCATTLFCAHKTKGMVSWTEEAVRSTEKRELQPWPS